MHKFKFLAITTILILALSLAGPSLVAMASSLAATDPGLGTSASFSVLGSTTVTNTGLTTLGGSVGVWPGPAISDLGTLTVGGATHVNDIVAQQAQTDAGTADGSMLSQASTGSVGPALDGLSLVSGVYDIGAGRINGGVLTLNGPGVYIFRASSDFVSAGSVSLTNGARACDVYWHVESLATINGSSFVGTIIAKTGIHFGDSVTLDGRALAIGGDVTLINDTITGPTCATPVNIRAQKTAQAASISGLPNTGGAPIRNDEFPVMLLIVSCLVILALALGIRAYRRSDQPKQ